MKDSTGEINAKLWININIFNVRFKKGDFVAVKGTVLEYRKINFLNISSIKKVDKNIYSEYNINNNDIKQYNLVNDKLWKKIFLLLGDIKDKNLKNLIINIYTKNKTKIYNLSTVFDEDGSSEYFLKHLVSVLEILFKFKSFYKNINIDLVITICMFYKIGLIHKKIKNNHSSVHYLSWELIQEEILLNKNFSEQLSIQLQKIITNFNNEERIKTLNCKEALMSYYISNLDQKMNYYNKFIVNDIFNMSK